MNSTPNRTISLESPTAPGVEEVLMPGEPERMRAKQAEKDGVRIPGGTWRQWVELAEELGIDLPENGF